MNEYITPIEQYTEISIRGRKGSLSPRYIGCRNWPQISTSNRPTRQLHISHPITNPSLWAAETNLIDPQSLFFPDGAIFSVSSLVMNCAENPNHISTECSNSNNTFIRYSCGSNKSGNNEQHDTAQQSWNTIHQYNVLKKIKSQNTYNEKLEKAIYVPLV